MNWIHATCHQETILDRHWVDIWAEVDVDTGYDPRSPLGELRPGQSGDFSTEIPLEWFISRLGGDFSFELLGDGK